MIRHYLSRTGFRRQLTVIVSAAILGLALFSSIMNAWEARARMRDYFTGQGQRVADNLARQSTLALLFHSAENARDVVASTLTFPDVVGVQISDARQKVLLSRVNQGARLEPAVALPATVTRAGLVAESGDAWLFAAPVYGGQGEASPFDLQERQPQLLGYVHVQVGKGTLQRLTLSLLLGNLAITLSFAVILLVLVGFLTRNMINPLNALSQLMRRAEQGESGMRAAPAGPRDLVDMAHAFNQMMNVLEQREAAAVNMAQMKAQFAATVSHEVRTPLNGVVGMLDMLKEMRLTQRQQECVEVAWNSSRTLIELINNILDFSKMEAGKLALEETEFELRKLLEESIELVARPAQQKGVEIAYLLGSDVPPRITGDALRLRQILINLLGNAVKFTDRGEVALRVTRVRPPHQADGQLTLSFEVRDSGIGMSAEAQRHLFESYAQPDPSTTRRYGGTGLGLAICKQLVTLLGGQIGVASVAGAGTTFTFSIACRPGHEEAAPAPEPALAGVRVLVIERSAIMRDYLQDTLARHHMQCNARGYGSEALNELKAAAAAGQPYRVAILDIGATDDHGTDLASRIEAAELETRLLVLDRHGPPGGGTTMSGHATIGKPLRQQRLLQALRELVAGHRRGGPEPAPALPAPRPPQRQYRVLVAEDNRTNQMVAAGMLSMNGCVCEFAADGREAVEAAHRQQFDLILMDCSMPEMDGYEATAHIRLLEQALGRRTPLVAMTANTQRGDAEKCLAAGMDDYLAKPITLVELRHKLERWLPRDDAEPGPASAPAQEAPQAIEPAAPAAPCPLDLSVFDKLREILGDTLPHAISPYLEDTPAYLDELEQAVASGDFETARARAHAIKGSSGNFGAGELSQLAQTAEQFAIAHQLARIAPLLPRLRTLYEDVAAFLSKELSGPHSAPDGAPEDTPQVLVVDDDRSTRSTLRYTLQRDGFRVEEAADGAQALAMLKRFQPDVILMDAVMPVMDGFAACARLQELPGGSAIPVLMITALQDNSSVERAFAAGASDYIPKPIHYAVLSQRVRRIIEANRAEKRIRHLAYNDLLTGLPNRTLFFDLLAKSIETAAQGGTQVGVLFMDLDRFKYVNDNLGHDVGDRLLQAVAQRVRNTVRTVDTVARLGGDEFTVVLGDLENPAAAATAAHNICRMLAAPFQIDGHDIFVTSSVGIAMYPHDGADVATLVKHADSAMYRAKKKNSGFQFYEASMEQSISEHVRMESDLRRALEQNQLEVYYQPQASVDTGQIVGMEALVRWNHPSRGMIGPGDFISLAEETGLIIPLGDWVLRSACAQLQQWLRQGLPELRVAVNLSVRQLLQKDFAASVEAVLNETGLPPRLLELEITESTLMENAQDTLAALHRLHTLGVRLSIDDFGTGYSSLSYLKRFPVDIIKIDRSFVRDVPQDADDVAIVTAIIALAHSLRLELVAEGVETAAQLEFLRGCGCDLMQGYHLSKPVPADQFAALIRQREAAAARH